MHVVHTAAAPPKRGKIIFATIGCTENSSVAPKVNVKAKRTGMNFRGSYEGSHQGERRNGDSKPEDMIRRPTTTWFPNSVWEPSPAKRRSRARTGHETEFRPEAFPYRVWEREIIFATIPQ